MRIIYNGEDFHLPTGFSTTFTRTNALLTDRGEQTKSFTLPGSPHNLRLAGWSNRIDNTYKPLEDIQVMVIDGLMVRLCNMSFNAPASAKSGLNCTLYMGSGELYSRINDTKLKNLPWPVIKSPDYDTQNLAQRVQYLIDLLKDEYNVPDNAAHFRVAPLASDKEVTEKISGAEVKKNFILNEFDTQFAELDLLNSDTAIIENFAAEYTRTFVEDSKPIDITIGYGMTPFLKVRYVVETMFSHFGFTFDYTELASYLPVFTHQQCFENNVADAIYSGVLLYSQLVPDLTIKEFLTRFETAYGGRFIVNEVARTVTFKRFKKALTTATDIDLSVYARGEIAPEKPEFTRVNVKLTSDVSTSEESTLKVENIEFDLHLKKVLPQTFKLNMNPFSADIDIMTVQCNGILHLNSVLEVGGKTTSEDAATNTRFDIITIPDEMHENQIIVNDIHDVELEKSVFYRPCYTFLQLSLTSLNTDIEKLQLMYSNYCTFRQQSNIPASIPMQIPESVLEKLDFTVPKIIQSQKVLIESIEYPLGAARATSVQTVNFRTVRSYQDRP